jgi:hypothetical protein
MSFRGVRRAFNMVLGVAALFVVAAVLMDLFGIGPRRKESSAAVGTLIQTPAITTVPLVEILAGAKTEKIKSPARICSATTLMPFGDSLTAGWEGYRGPLFRALESRRIPVNFVGSGKIDPNGGGDPDHESHPGFLFGPNDRLDAKGAPSNLYDNVDTWFAIKPSIALVLIGSQELSDPSVRANAATAYEALIAKIRERSPDTLLVLAELPPSKKFPATDPALVALNAKMKQLASVERNDLIYFAGINAKLKQLKFDPTKDLTEDQVRFTLSGGKKFAIAIEPFMSGAIVRDRSRRCVATRQPTATSTSVPSSDTDVVVFDDSGFVTETP